MNVRFWVTWRARVHSAVGGVASTGTPVGWWMALRVPVDYVVDGVWRGEHPCTMWWMTWEGLCEGVRSGIGRGGSRGAVLDAGERSEKEGGG